MGTSLFVYLVVALLSVANDANYLNCRYIVNVSKRHVQPTVCMKVKSSAEVLLKCKKSKERLISGLFEYSAIITVFYSIYTVYALYMP